ncbi:hypothetical protein BJ999_001446 [Actinomadura citrea]|uniref:Uncharacterized protein n=1 Tax=Actinomadura citrea TaxID=46158 RepID=A0A7Y9G9S9_9ACTN|nr:hypothetical protein [Actinomadura citrea]
MATDFFGPGVSRRPTATLIGSADRRSEPISS